METGSGGLEMFLVRVGDAERDACMEILTEHHVRGRLSVEEFDHRERVALNAVTAADLAALVADLPTAADAVRDGYGAPRGAPSPARTVALSAGPPAALVAASAVLAASLPSEAMFAGFITVGALGYSSHWIGTRVRRQREQ